MPFEKFNEQRLFTSWDSIDNVQGTTGYNLLSGSAAPIRVGLLIASNTDTIDHELTFAFDPNGTSSLGTVTVPAGAGHSTAIPSVDILAALLGSGEPLLLAESGSLYVLALVAVVSPYMLGFAMQWAEF